MKKKKLLPEQKKESPVTLPVTRKVFISSPENLVTRDLGNGILETIDTATGNVICQSASEFLALELGKGTPIDKLLPRGFVELEVDGKTIIFDQGIDTDKYANQNYTLSSVMRDLIFNDIIEGASLYSVSKKKNRPPYAILCKTYYRDSKFRELVDAARKFRAEMLYDRIMQNAERLEMGDLNKAEVDGLTNATNFYRWGCEVSNGEVYGNKKDTNQGGVTIIVSTGVNREDKPIEIEVKPTQKIDDGFS